jgi:hypothetical protein
MKDLATQARAQREAEQMDDRRLAELLAQGPEGFADVAWQALQAERTRRELGAARRSADQRPAWAGMGFRQSVELGVGIAVGFAIVSGLGALLVFVVRLLVFLIVKFLG